MVNYRELKLGDNMEFKVQEYGASKETVIYGTIKNVSEDHAIMVGLDKVCYWIDDDTAYQFHKISRERMEVE